MRILSRLLYSAWVSPLGDLCSRAKCHSMTPGAVRPARNNGVQLPDAMGSRQNPVVGHQGASTSVTPSSSRKDLQGDLG